MNRKELMRRTARALMVPIFATGLLNIAQAAEKNDARFVDQRIAGELPGIPISAESTERIIAELDQNRPGCAVGSSTSDITDRYQKKRSALRARLEAIVPDSVTAYLLDMALTDTRLDNQGMELIVDVLDTMGTSEADDALENLYSHADIIAERMMMQKIDTFVATSLAARDDMRKTLGVDAQELDKALKGTLAYDRLLAMYAAAQSQGLVDDQALLRAIDTHQKLIQSFVIRSGLAARSNTFLERLKVHEGKTDLAGTAYRDRWLTKN